MLGRPSTGATHVADWMLEAALGTTSVAEAFEGMVLRLREEGVQIDRAHLALTTLHPLVRGAGATWTPEGGMETEGYAFDRDQARFGWYQSPIHYIIKNGVSRLRRRLAGPTAMLDFPVLETFAEQGLTDYVLVAQPFDSFYAPVDLGPHDANPDIAGMSASFATARAAGFSDEEVETLHWLSRPLAMLVKMADQRQVAINVAECYIGREAGPRVLGGEIRRGDFDSTEAVVWLADLRDSTALSMALPREDYIATINRFFDCASGAVEAEGGEPLAFIGDGVLAIFPIAAMGEAGAREAAYRAARGADAALTAWNEERKGADAPPLRWGVALHAGRLDYGNIGSPARHSWSVIGPVVNETARLEGLTKTLGETIVASRAFVDGLGAVWRPQGAHDLRGVAGPFEVFAPPRAATEAA